MNNYSVLVVDDELMARKKILKSIKWEKVGVNTFFEAQNSFEALDIIRRDTPDIVILDLKMPGMSGVDLLDVLQKEKLNAKIVVSSGYSDFGAAQKMLESGKVLGYLLKPVIEDYLLEAVVKCIEKIESEIEANRLAEDLRKAKRQINHRKLKDLIYGRFDIDGEAPEFKDDYAAMATAVIFCGENIDTIRRYCMEYIHLHPNESLKDFFNADQLQYVVAFFAAHTPDFAGDMQNICLDIARQNRCSVGVGRICKSVYDVNMSYKEALLACECRSFVSKDVIQMEDLEIQYAEKADYNKRVEYIKQLIHQGENERLNSFLEDVVQSEYMRTQFIRGLSALNPGNLSMVKAYFGRLAEDVFPDCQDNLNLTSLFAAQDISDMLTVLKKTFAQNTVFNQQNNLLRKINLVTQAKQYISENYTEKLTLDVVADMVFICPSYLSRLFSEIEGCTFVEYVTDVRLSQARLLLNEYGYKIYEIAEKVGYHTVKHFIRVFKDKYGITPSQYREQHAFDGIVKEMGTE